MMSNPYFDLVFSVTGDCQNNGSGAYLLSIINGVSPDYRIEFVNPSVPLSYSCTSCTNAGSYIFLGPQETSFLAYNLTGGTYSLVVYDSFLPTNNSTSLSIHISSGGSFYISGVQNTTCGLDNGAITATTNMIYGPTREFSLYDINDNFINSGSTSLDSYVFGSLEYISAGTYYVIGTESGCTGKTESVIVKSSTSLNYSYYVVNNSGCYNSIGKIFITGLTGVYPFTYNWSNGVTGVDNITGLTSGSYSVTITDGTGCQLTKLIAVNNADPLVVASIQSNAPSCNGNDGEITVFINGGSPPYYFSGSNGVTDIVFDTQYTFTNLAASGSYSFSIKDAGLCEVTTNTTLLPANSFSVQNVNIINANCNGVGGKIQIYLLGATTPSYTYQLSGSSGVNIVTNQFTTYEFDNLSAGEYNITVSDISSGSCVFTNTYTIIGSSPFTISTQVTGTTCNRTNGRVLITASSGNTGDLEVTLTNGFSQLMTSSAITITNLNAGTYGVTVRDTTTGCIASTTFVIPLSSSIDFLPLLVTNNSLSLSITQGTPPFNITWSGDTTGILPFTGTTITGLTNGYYCAIVSDSNGCLRTTPAELIYTPTRQGNSTTYNLCSNSFTTNLVLIPKRIPQVFFDGYVDIIAGQTNCVLNSALFTLNIYVNNTLYSNVIYTATNINEVIYISDDYYYNSVRNTLLSIYGIGDVFINSFTNTIVITTDCNIPNNLLVGASIIVDLVIDYDINCRFCNSLFRNCSDPTDEIVAGIVSGNFFIGDIIIYDNKCYELTADVSNKVAVINKDYPDYVNGNCISCETYVQSL